MNEEAIRASERWVCIEQIRCLEADPQGEPSSEMESKWRDGFRIGFDFGIQSAVKALIQNPQGTPGND